MSNDDSKSIEITVLTTEFTPDGVTWGGKEYCRVPISLALQNFKLIQFGFLVPLSEQKLVEIHHDEESMFDVLEKYQKKGLENILFEKTHYSSFLAHMKEALSNQFYNPMSKISDQVTNLNDAYELIKGGLEQMGLSPMALDLAEDISRKSLEIMKKSPNLFQFFKDFKGNCKEEFLMGIFTGYLCAIVIDCFEWGSEPIKAKCNMASLLCDVMLNKEQIDSIRECKGEWKTLQVKVFDHPLNTARMVRDTMKDASKEVIDIIEQHHELPNGKGFPRGLAADKFSQLAAIHNVCHDFIFELIRTDFDYNKRNQVLEKMYKKYRYPNFEHVIWHLYDLFDGEAGAA